MSFTPGTSNDADDAYTFWFDPETGRIEQFGYDFDNGLRFRRATSFERVGGVLFSDQDNYAGRRRQGAGGHADAGLRGQQACGCCRTWRSAT